MGIFRINSGSAPCSGIASSAQRAIAYYRSHSYDYALEAMPEQGDIPTVRLGLSDSAAIQSLKLYFG
jgi:hypothetical protein